MVAFSVVNPSPRTTTLRYFEVITTRLPSKKKRRRRNKSTEEEGDEEESDLPDFDLDEPRNNNEESSVVRKVVATTTHTNPDEITPNMMGTDKSKPVRSVKELLADRSLEKMLLFDEENDPATETLPDLADLAAASQPQVSKKKVRQAERKATAVASKAEEEENPLSKIPFLTNDKGKVQVMKIVEAGTWLAIALMVGWELYINSPLFERVAPMAPVVY